MDYTQSGILPELAAILSSLAQHTSTTLEHPIIHPDNQALDTSTQKAIPAATSDEGYDPCDPLIDWSKVELRTAPQPASRAIDPATITNWASGLRCVSKISTQNADFSKAIKSMMNNQRRNEFDWYSRRQELKKLQAQRGAGSSELNSIM